MDLYLKQKFFSWGDKFTVYTVGGDDRYYVHGEPFSIGKKLRLYDTSGQELLQIRQKPFSWTPRYYICRGHRVLAEVVKEPSFLHAEYRVKGPNWHVRGDFFSHDYTITDADGIAAATVCREWFTLGDAYAIHISPFVDEELVLAIVLVIDACLASATNSSVSINT